MGSGRIGPSDYSFMQKLKSLRVVPKSGGINRRNQADFYTYPLKWTQSGGLAEDFEAIVENSPLYYENLPWPSLGLMIIDEKIRPSMFTPLRCNY